MLGRIHDSSSYLQTKQQRKLGLGNDLKQSSTLIFYIDLTVTFFQKVKVRFLQMGIVHRLLTNLMLD